MCKIPKPADMISQAQAHNAQCAGEHAEHSLSTVCKQAQVRVASLVLSAGVGAVVLVDVQEHARSSSGPQAKFRSAIIDQCVRHVNIYRTDIG